MISQLIPRTMANSNTAALMSSLVQANAVGNGHKTNIPRGVLISPATYLRFLQTLNKIYETNRAKIEDKKLSLEKLIEKLEAISVQVQKWYIFQSAIMFTQITDHWLDILLTA